MPDATSSDIVEYTNKVIMTGHIIDLNFNDKRQGFIEAALHLSTKFPQTPHIIRGVLPKANLLSYPALAG